MEVAQEEEVLVALGLFQGTEEGPDEGPDKLNFEEQRPLRPRPASSRS